MKRNELLRMTSSSSSVGQDAFDPSAFPASSSRPPVQKRKRLSRTFEKQKLARIQKSKKIQNLSGIPSNYIDVTNIHKTLELLESVVHDLESIMEIQHQNVARTNQVSSLESSKSLPEIHQTVRHSDSSLDSVSIQDAVLSPSFKSHTSEDERQQESNARPLQSIPLERHSRKVVKKERTSSRPRPRARLSPRLNLISESETLSSLSSERVSVPGDESSSVLDLSAEFDEVFVPSAMLYHAFRSDPQTKVWRKEAMELVQRPAPIIMWNSRSSPIKK